ncbi:hypothetical protein [Alkalimarinus sediminis]|uniref:Lipase helper protein n=1 Tax=Alkalimarinus sediminis TaxID=1632866 RepID=A0A9E8HQZ3_9ALTE|nr:hypothetical protein [Alkalimarinus sediminis]UZW74174.1 hypothetical protein NNL22_14260 [Alkalimarinus sediminis]
MLKRPALTIGITTLFLMGFIPWYLDSSVEPRESLATQAMTQNETAPPFNDNTVNGNKLNSNIYAENSKGVSTTDAFNTQLAQELYTKYGDKIEHLAVQANLFKVREFVIGRYPEDGRNRFSTIIQMAFPDHASSIMNIIALMEQYTQWLAENYRLLNDMPPLERDGHLWEKRRALFGESAEIIWSDERELLAQKQRNVQQEIHRLGTDTDLSIDEKLYQLTTTLSENYGDLAQEMAIDPGMIASVFFGFDSVQQTLKSLSPQERQQEINRVRQQLGYSDAQIELAEKKDQIRNQRWTNGLSYMAEREALTNQLEGDALNSALSELRESYFKREAYTIAKEEESGFYRYARPRVYGRN